MVYSQAQGRMRICKTNPEKRDEETNSHSINSNRDNGMYFNDSIG
jgi:hypothetical protein